MDDSGRYQQFPFTPRTPDSSAMFLAFSDAWFCGAGPERPLRDGAIELRWMLSPNSLLSHCNTRGLAKDYHFVDLVNGERLSPGVVTKKFQTRKESTRSDCWLSGKA